MLITEPYYNTDNKIPKVHKDIIHYYYKDGTLGPRASISIHKSLQDQCWELENFTNRDTIAIKMKSANSYIIFASIYMENSTNTTDFPPESLSNLNNYATKSDLPLIIASDTNSHSVIWGNKKTDLRGETLLDTFNTLDLHWANKGKQPTFFNSRGHSSIIDLTIGNKKGLVIVHNWQVSDKIANSDHKYITYTVQTKNKNNTTKCRNIRSIDWEKYREKGKSSCTPNNITSMNIMDETTLNQAVEMFHQMIIRAYEESCPYT